MKRPLLRVALPYVGGILLAQWLEFPFFPILGITLVLAVLTLVWPRARPWLLYPLLLLTGCTNATFHTAVLSPNDLRAILSAEPQLASVRGTIEETPTVRMFEQEKTLSWRTLARLKVSAVQLAKRNWRPASGRIAVTTPAPMTNFFAGQEVEVSGVAALPRLAVAPGTFDYRAYLRQQGIYFHLQAGTEQDWVVLHSPPRRPLADRFRDWARAALARGMPAEDESLRLEWALTLGWKPALTEEVSEPFVRAATYHIFAVDGLRMAIIFGIFFGLFRAVGLPRWLSGLILIPLIWFYVALTGWPASAIRATVMLTVLIVGWVLRRPSDVLNSLFAAALLILICQPQQLFQAGFQLSFFVVLCLILILPPCWRLLQAWTAPDPLLPSSLRRHWPGFVRIPVRYCGEVLLTSFAAWIGSIPLVAYYFNIITPVSTPANLVAVPLCVLALISNLASLLLAGWLPMGAELFNHAGWFVMECIRVSSIWFAGWPKAYFYVAAPSVYTSSLYYALLLGLVTGWLLRPQWRVWKCAGATVAVLIWGWGCWQECRLTRLTIVPVNGGTAIYYDAPGNGHDLLVDTGTTNAVQFITKGFLRAQGVNRLNTLLLTHGDLHHIGGAKELADLFQPQSVYISPLRFRSVRYRRTIEYFKQSPDLLRSVARPKTIGDWQVMHPESSDRFPRADDGAVVLNARLSGARVLLLSDLGRSGQDKLLERSPELRADIVVTGLPSNGEPVCEALLEQLQPRLLIVTDSLYPASEHASVPLRERLARCPFPVLYTADSGTIMLLFKGQDGELSLVSGERLKFKEAQNFLPIDSRHDKIRQLNNPMSAPKNRHRALDSGERTPWSEVPGQRREP